jgi:hypothetical protein
VVKYLREAKLACDFIEDCLERMEAFLICAMKQRRVILKTCWMVSVLVLYK